MNATLTGTRTVLVVEDDGDMREAARDAIAAEGFPTATAANGVEAIEYLENEPPPGIIVLDLMMPVMNGWEFLDWLSSRPELGTIPVIVISASRECERARSLYDGLAYCLAKPFRLDTLLWALNKVRDEQDER